MHHWRRSPAFVFVPPEVGAWAADSVPWRAEPLLYASDLADRLPEGLTMARGLRVDEREEQTAALWIEAVDCDPLAWTHDDTVRAARALGRLSGSPRVAPLAAIDPPPWHIENFVAGRLAHTVLPGLYDDATWWRPAVAERFAGLRGPLEAVARLTRRCVPQQPPAPRGRPRLHPDRLRLLAPAAGGLRPSPSSWSATSRSAGRTRPTCPSAPLPAWEAYAPGLADEGLEVPEEQVRRGHAVSLMLFNGLPSLPAEVLPDEDAFEHWVRQRAGIARYALDVLARTERAA